MSRSNRARRFRSFDENAGAAENARPRRASDAIGGARHALGGRFSPLVIATNRASSMRNESLGARRATRAYVDVGTCLICIGTQIFLPLRLTQVFDSGNAISARSALKLTLLTF
jgi:hypothetical protein